MKQEELDFKNMNIAKLFRKQLFPTLLGMVASALFVIVDGIIVGRFISSDALAAVNIVVPVMTLATGISLMFGMGGAIVAQINISRGKKKIADINFTQSLLANVSTILLMTIILVSVPNEMVSLLGANEQLQGLAVEYLFWYSFSLLPMALLFGLPFFVRFTNPRYAMWALLFATVLNLGLDYLFVAVFHMGLMGAAVATGIGETVGVVILIFYFFRKECAVRMTPLKLSRKSILLSFRNIWHMIKLGFPSFLTEGTLTVMFLAGNLAFIRYLGADGVAAFSVISYIFPMIFMVFNAIVQSIQPIVSYNYGCGQLKRSSGALKLGLFSAILFGIGMCFAGLFLKESIVSLFIPDVTSMTWAYAVSGLPLFSFDFVFFGINVIFIGYYASIEKISRSLIITALRGFLPGILFIILPLWLSISGLWLSVVATDFLITILISLFLIRDKYLIRNGRVYQSVGY